MFSVLSGLGVELLSLFMKKCHTVFQSDCTVLYSHQQCIKVPVFPYPCQCLLVPIFHILANTGFLNYNSPTHQEVVSCGFHLHFLSDQSCWTSFHVFVGHMNIFFEEISIQILCWCFLPLPPEPLAVKVQSLSHWTTREFPLAYF